MLDQLAQTDGKASLQEGGIDVLRHIASVAVVAIHSWSKSRYPASMEAPYLAAIDYIDGAVLAFFLISGYLSRAPSSARGFVGKRLQRLLIPYLIFSLFYGVVLCSLGMMSVNEMLISTAAMRGTGPQLYFLPYLLMIDVAVMLAFQAVPRSKLAPIGFGVALLVALMLRQPISTGPAYGQIPYYLMGYLAGVLLRLYQRPMAIAQIAFFVLLGTVDPRFYDAALAVAMFLILMSLSRFFPMRLPGSGAVYLLHTPLVNGVITLLLFKASVLTWANLVLTVVLTYTLVLAFTAAVLKWLPSARRLILE